MKGQIGNFSQVNCPAYLMKSLPARPVGVSKFYAYGGHIYWDTTRLDISGISGTGTVISVTANYPLTGGTFYTYGSIGLDTSKVFTAWHLNHYFEPKITGGQGTQHFWNGSKQFVKVNYDSTLNIPFTRIGNVISPTNVSDTVAATILKMNYPSKIL